MAKLVIDPTDWGQRYFALVGAYGPVWGMTGSGDDALQRAMAALRECQLPKKAAEHALAVQQALDAASAAFEEVRSLLGDSLVGSGIFEFLAEGQIDPNDKGIKRRVWQRMGELRTAANTGREALLALDGALDAIEAADAENGAMLRKKVGDVLSILDKPVANQLGQATRCFAGHAPSMYSAISPPRGRGGNRGEN